MVAGRGQTSVWPGFLIRPVSHPAYGCYPNPMGYIKHLVREGDMEDDHKFLGAADYLCDMAKALMNDIEIARNNAH